MNLRSSLLGTLVMAFTFVTAQGCAVEADDEAPGEDDMTSSSDIVTANASLKDVLKYLGDEVRKRSPGTELAISVKDFKTGETQQLNGDVKHQSASSAKAVWVAAALQKVGEGPVKPFAIPIFRSSDNTAAGRVIDLVGSNEMNAFYDRAGMKNSGFISWNYSGTRQSTNRPKAIGIHNYLTANDAVSFLGRVEDGSLLTQPMKTALMDWMKEAPKSGTGGWLGARLPKEAKARMMHKGGWLPGLPGRDEQLNDIGMVDVAEGGATHRYGVAILARHGRDYWGKQAPFVEFASCMVYRAIAKQPKLSCAARS